MKGARSLRRILFPASVLWIGCLLQPEKENYLRLGLSDTLANFDSVEIVLFARDTSQAHWADTTKPLATAYSGFLSDPGNVPPYRLDGLGLQNGVFVVRVRAFKFEGQLAVETFIRKDEGGRQTVDHTPLPLPTPYTVSLQYMDIIGPHIQNFFDSSQTDHEVLVPTNIDSVEINAKASDPRAAVFADTDTIPLDVTHHHVVRVDTGSVTLVPLRVVNHGHERIYHLNVRRDASAGPAHITRFATSPKNNWTPSFQATTYNYNLSVALADSVLRFDTLNVDLANTLLLMDDQPLADSLPPPLPLAHGSTVFVLKLILNGGENAYNFTVTRP